MNKGGTLSFEIMRCYEVQTKDDENIKNIGQAQISNEPEENQDTNSRFVTVIEIDNAYRRRGIATKLYSVIESDLALRGLYLVENQHQTNDAKTFWKKYRSRKKTL